MSVPLCRTAAQIHSTDHVICHPVLLCVCVRSSSAFANAPTESMHRAGRLAVLSTQTNQTTTVLKMSEIGDHINLPNFKDLSSVG